jgi:prepilin-type N-terminal cleavage/methylation domain-containing protein
MSGRVREAGFSLVELLVSMVVLLVVLMVTNGLLVESLRIFSNSGRELRAPGTELALRLLREDLHASAPIYNFAHPLDPTPFALECRRPERTESWEIDGTRLVRRTYAPDGRLLGTRPMLDGMVTFEWWTPIPGLVQVRLVRTRPAGASALRVATAAWKSADEELEAAQVVAASRLAWGAP